MTRSKSRKKSPAQGNRQGFAWSEMDFWIQFFSRIQERLEDLGVILFTALALISAFGFMGLTEGDLINPLNDFLRRWLGWGALGIPVILGLLSYWLYRKRRNEIVQIPWPKVIAFEIFVINALALLAILDELSVPSAEEGGGGGLVGWGIATLIGDMIGKFGARIFFLVLLIISGLYAFRSQLQRIAAFRLRRVGIAPTTIERSPQPGVRRRKKRKSERVPKEYRKSFELPEFVDDKSEKLKERDVRLPPFEILDQGTYSRQSAKEINITAGLIEKTLAEFGLPVSVKNFRTGPSVTQFAVEPGFIDGGTQRGARRSKVRVSQITALAKDLALAISAPRVRIEAPVPGQSFVGIEVPNRRSSLVRLGPILQSDAFQSTNSLLAIGLGRDVAGNAVAADLGAMPHLLIAGTTGSGKSVCITSLASSLVFNNSPEDLRLVMIDPKMVELIRFNGLPHLLGKTETDLERIVGVLRWVMREMDRRYMLLERARVRDIERYNAKMRRRPNGEKLPRLVVMIDELADLMMMVPDQTEQTIVRLAQMARATGIHLVVATQRPSTDVVTGLIKANFPARISFAVSSSIDSRVILDSSGAESLMGRGDMLFLSPEAAAPIRLQGAYISDIEIERLVEFWRVAVGADALTADDETPWEPMLQRQAVVDDRDELIELAIDVVRKSGQASASLLQRRLRIGYPRAARLMDELEELGVIGRAQSGGKTREVLLGDEDDLAQDEV